jgi:S-adenosylmethionine decarboxylase
MRPFEVPTPGRRREIRRERDWRGNDSVETTLPLFEGPEKKLEVILFRGRKGLRSNEDGRWGRVVSASRAEILSRVSTEAMDAYLLSESSLFVWDDRVLMITCGRTTLVRAVPEIVRIVGMENIAFVFYEQKNFLFPDRQPSDFEHDVAELSRLFPGKYYKLGPGNFDHINVFYWSHAAEAPKEDATLQLLMHKMSPEILEPFCAGPNGATSGADRYSGLERLYPRPMRRDAHLFDPCGYSLNAVAGGDYFTVHVTPQAAGSYASFETNIFEPDFCRTIRRVVDIFRPGRFSVALTTSMDEPTRSTHDTVGGPLADYVVADKSLYEFDCGYSVTFLNYLIRKEESHG